MSGVALLVFVLYLAVALLCRNEQVYRYRRAVIDGIHAKNMRDINEGRGMAVCHARWARLDSVPYESMVLPFWKPLESFGLNDLLDNEAS